MFRLLPYIAAGVLAWLDAADAAAPIFENRTPVGFSPADSTTRADFVVGGEVSVLVDLDQAATEDFPAIAHFHAIEKSDQLSTTDTDGMQIDIAMVDVAPFGTHDNSPAAGVTQFATLDVVVHMAWIEETNNPTGAGVIYSGGTTPTYEVVYAQSTNGGATFSTPVSVSGGTSYHSITTGTSFSTLDLEVESGGNPHVTYAFISTANRARNRNVYYSNSTDGGVTWPSVPEVVNDLTTVGNLEGRDTAFPRMAIDDRDNIFIAYVRGSSRGTGTDDVMLAKVNRSDFSMVTIGSLGTAGSSGGVRVTDDTKRHTGPDIAIGDGDALHVAYFNDDDDRIEHKRSITDTTWADISSTGWDQNVDGASVGSFIDEVAGNTALEQEADFFFPSITVDRARIPDRVYSVFKFGSGGNEGVRFNRYDDDGTTGTGITWGTASSVWSTGPVPLFDDGSSTNIELDWTITERVSAVVDDRLDDRGDLHIAFTAGHSGSSSEHDIYYARYNGASWTLPEKVADDDSDGTGTTDGIASGDGFLLSPAIATHPEFDHVFLAFAGGTGEGFGVKGVFDVDHHPYFKILGRAISSEDESVPVGGFQYTLSYTPINPQTVAADVDDNPIYVHAADPTDGSALGAGGASTDGFLTGNWETVGTTLADDDKFFEGLRDEDPTSTNEWGDDGDKIGLLVKLNVLGSDSATNLQVVLANTASAGSGNLDARTVKVGSAPIVGFTPGTFFALGADIDIVPSNNAPAVQVIEPDGVGDTGNTSFTIEYTLTDSDDDLDGSLQAALYAYPTKNLKTVQDIRIFGTLIVDENDDSANNVAGTDDFEEGSNRDYTWDDPPAALKSTALFASILRVQSGSYYIYLIADDGRNPPVFAVSPGALTIRHSPIIRQIDPIVADTVDTGVRTGLKANPYDLDFSVLDYDSDARVQLFYAAASGITSVSPTGTYPNQKFVLGKSVTETRGTAITDSTFLTDQDKEFAWDVKTPLVKDGSYFLYAVATDSITTTVANSTTPLIIKHSPSFVFFEPTKDTQRSIDSGSQSVFTIQWQKGPGDNDLDHNATIDLYFTTDDPAVTDHSTDAGASSTSLTSDLDDTRTIKTGLLAARGKSHF